MSEHKKKNNLGHRRSRQPWPMLFLLGAGALLIIGALFAFKKPAASKVAIEVTGAPSLKIDKQKVDLGNVKLGQTADVKFALSNVGDQPLRFNKAPYVEVLKGC